MAGAYYSAALRSVAQVRVAKGAEVAAVEVADSANPTVRSSFAALAS